METKGIEKYSGLMFRYIFPLTKQAKRIMKNSSTVEWNQNYPKEKDLKFWKMMGTRNYIEVPMPEFNYEIIEYNKRNIEAHNDGATLDSFLSAVDV